MLVTPQVKRTLPAKHYPRLSKFVKDRASAFKYNEKTETVSVTGQHKD